MANTVVERDLGPISAYAIAVKYGYTGTEQEWAQLQINAPNISGQAIQAVQQQQQTSVAAVTSAKTAALGNIDTAKTGAVADVNTAKTTAVGVVEATGQTVANSLPSDYTTLESSFAALGFSVVNGKLNITYEVSQE